MNPHPNRLCALGVLWTAVFVQLCSALFAQSPGPSAMVTGTVTNAATGRTLQGALVAIKGTDREAVTDSQGVFRIENAPLPPWILERIRHVRQLHPTGGGGVLWRGRRD